MEGQRDPAARDRRGRHLQPCGELCRRRGLSGALQLVGGFEVVFDRARYHSATLILGCGVQFRRTAFVAWQIDPEMRSVAGHKLELGALAGYGITTNFHRSEQVGYHRERFRYMAGLKIVHVPYKGTGPALNDSIAGNVQLIFGSVSTTLQHIKSGRLRGLAVTTAKRISAMPELPTVAESGLIPAPF